MRVYPGYNVVASVSAGFNPSGAVGASGQASAPSMTTTVNGDELVFFSSTTAQALAFGAPAGFGNASTQPGSSTVATSLGGWDMYQATAGATGSVASSGLTSGNTWDGILVALQLTASTPTPVPTTTPTPTPTATPSPTPTPTPSPTATPTATPTPIGGITPPTLVNVQNPVSYGADSTGSSDSTSAFASAISAGDVLVPAGTFKITGHLYFPSNRHMQCTLTHGTYGTIESFLKNTSQTTTMIDMDSTNNSSIFYCGFVGPNANISATSTASLNNSFFVRVSGPNGNNNQLVGNDFNGIGGFVGAVFIGAADSQQPPPNATLIEWNTAEHCGYYFLQEASSTNSTVSNNTLNDCSGAIEAADTGQAITGNVVSNNTWTFTYGVGCRASILSGCQGFDGLTCGAAAEVNYSGNTCSNNTVNGSHGSTICESSPCANTSNPAVYTGNTCTGGCVLNNYNE